MDDWRKEFPIFKKQKGLIYFDSAATSLKPQTVIRAINDYNQKYSLNSHKIIAQKINGQAEEISFLPSTTHALNILALSLKDSIAKEKKARIDFLPLNNELTIDIGQLDKYISKRTKIVSFVHVSNSLGVINPVAEITQKIKKINPDCLIILDACQRGGKKIGPMEKNTGQNLPLSQKMEVGTLPLAEIFGLKAAFEFLNKLGTEEIYEYENNLRNYALQKLKKLKDMNIYNQNLVSANIITFNLSPYHAHDLTDYLGKNNILIQQLAELILPYLQPNIFLLLQGGLGVGKTTLTQTLAQKLGIKQTDDLAIFAELTANNLNEYQNYSTASENKNVSTCANCSPAYKGGTSGKVRMGRAEKFHQRQQKAQAKAEAKTK
ncbi:12910_t:CDS:2 [Entrophospora sp. SA101]|nr:12910_t:CDS:2 [Entrophospora sp. SA101]